MKLTEMSKQCLDYVKDNGGKVSVAELCEATNRAARSINASLTDLQKKGLIVREKEDVAGEDKPVTYACITAEGKEFVPTED